MSACFARDVVTNAQFIECTLRIAFTPSDGREALETLLPPGLQWTPQQGEELGARMRIAIEEAYDAGFGPIVLIGTDSPTLPSSILQTAIDLLGSDQADVALGPSLDGGYYLIGVRKPFAGLFDDVAWSTSSAYQDTVHNITATGLRLAELSIWYDVDTFADLARLRAELRAGARALETRQWIALHEDLDNRSYAE